MFEHLGPTPEVNIRKKRTNYKMYLSFLLLSVFVFMLAFSSGQGPSSYALEQDHLSGKGFVDASDKQVVSAAQNFSIFDFVVKVDQQDTALYKLNILVEGVYDLDFIRGLKLFHEGVQLGEVSKIDSEGKIYFDLSQYKLPLGQNTFSLFVNNSNTLKNTSVLKFSISQDDIFLIKGQSVFKPQASFPLESGLISIVDKGQIVAFDNYLSDDFLIRSDIPQRIASFSLGSLAEQADLSQVVLSYRGLDLDQDEPIDFVLEYNGQMISQASSQDGQIVFDLNKKIVLKDRVRQVFYVHTLGMPEDSYEISLQNASALGFLSGLNIDMKKPVVLSSFEARPYFIEISNGELDKKLSEGWNKIYSLKFKSQGINQAYINKLTWGIDKQNIKITEVEILKNQQPYIADIVLRDDKLILKADAGNPLLVSKEPTEIFVLAKISQISEDAKLEMVLLPDSGFDENDPLAGNIIWSDGDNFYNSYKLPYLPLPPSILDN